MASLNASLLDLVEQVQRSSHVISDYLQKNSLPDLSLKADAFPFFPGTGAPEIDGYPRLNADIQKARLQLREAAAGLSQLAAGPAEAAFSFALGHVGTACLQYMYHYRLADHVPVEGDISYRELAEKTGSDQNKSTRVLRYLISHNYFQEPRAGHVAHTALSKMALVPDFRHGIGYVTQESFVGGPKMVEAAEKFRGSEEKNETAWNLGQGTNLPMFEHFEHHPARMERFMGCMRLLASDESFSIKNVINAFDWRGLGKGVVVDVGGSFGHTCFGIAAAAPELSFVVQDLEKVIVQARKEHASDKDAGKVQFEVHNFFSPQPVKDADVYLLRFICHDYADKYAAQILSSITLAMGPKSRIIIVDEIMPDVGVLSKIEEQRARFMDIEMMLSFNSLERDEDSWLSLFKQAGPRLELRKTTKIPGNILAVMEVGLRHPN